MRRDELHYDLPGELIAGRPASPRDASRLLVLRRADGAIEHRFFRDLPRYVHPGDVLVVNDTRVLPARFFCRRASGGAVEALFLHERGPRWVLMLKPSGRLRVGETLAVVARPATPVGKNADTRAARIVLESREQRGEWLARPEPPESAHDFLARFGDTPLPPYIRRAAGEAADDAERYQTVYAARPGAVAAPTAGLHFTPRLLEELAAAGIHRATVTLHVGSGTFAPIDADDLSQHRMHAEWFELPAETLRRLDVGRRGGGRIVAVGTTSARVLESCPATLGCAGSASSAGDGVASGWTDIFLYPPYAFRNVDVLLTNFHLPESTLLALVMAFAGIEPIRAAYASAIRERYRFYSYGDAMLIV